MLFRKIGLNWRELEGGVINKMRETLCAILLAFAGLIESSGCVLNDGLGSNYSRDREMRDVYEPVDFHSLEVEPGIRIGYRF